MELEDTAPQHNRSDKLPLKSIKMEHCHHPHHHSSIVTSQCTSKSQATPSQRLRSMCKFAQITIIVLSYLGSLNVARCVHINSISQPQSFRNGLANSVVLDCDFTVDDNDDLLVVKWFHNDDPQHIYQWIQSRDMRIYSEKIKPYVDETFVVSDHPTRHRALRLLNPPPSLSGKYTCSVNSLQNEEINSTYLVIYEPAASFDIAAIEMEDDSNENEDGFNITCTAIGVYPEPEIKLYKVKSINETLEANEVQSNSTSVLSFRSVTDGFYSVTLVSHIEHNETIDQDEWTPARARLSWSKVHKSTQHQPRGSKKYAEHYECRLTIPNSDYEEVKRLAIQDGWKTKSRLNGIGSNWSESHCITALLLCVVATFYSHLSLVIG